MSDTAAAAPAKSKAVPIMMMLIVALLGILWFTTQRKSSSGGYSGDGRDDRASSRVSDRGGGMGPTLHMESFVVPLKSVNVERFAHVTIDFEAASDDDKERMSHSVPLIRDTVISFLIDQTVDDLRGSEGIAHLKDEVLTRVRKVLPGRHINAVFVTDFIVQ